jgi:three-Cys-motif partner protein
MREYDTDTGHGEVDDGIVWDAAPHTLAKHRVYQEYLSKWIPIMIQGWGGDVTIAEGFAGPGIYKGGQPGSPVIALRTLLDDPHLRTRARKLRFLFVEKAPRRADRLRGELEKAAEPVPLSELPKYGIDVDIATGSYDPTLVDLFDKHRAWDRPMLVILDSWGGAVKLDLVRRIAENPSSEVFITFEPQHFSRFAEAANIHHGDTVFGDLEWREVADQPSNMKTRWVIEKYRSSLAESGFPHVLNFELVNNRGQSLFLIFGTTHQRGLEKMKEAMWAVDPVHGVQYRDPADPNQQLLDIQPDPVTEPLQRELLHYLGLAAHHSATVAELRDYAFFKTVYKRSQVKPVLDELAAKGVVTGDAPDGHVRLGGAVRLNTTDTHNART